MAMFKCRDCYFENMPMPETLVATTPNQDVDVTLLALGKSRDAVTVYNGEALCEVHLTHKILG